MRYLINDGWSFACFKSGTDIETIKECMRAYMSDETQSSMIETADTRSDVTETQVVNHSEISGDIITPPGHVDIPHDWLIYDTENLYMSSIGVYVRKLEIDAGKSNTVYFDGVYMNTTVYLNGEKIYYWPYGYTPFEVDITKYQKQGKNVIMLVVDYREPNSRWYSGAGIFRDVYHYEREAAHLVTDSVYFSADKLSDGVFRVTVDAEVVDELIPGSYTKSEMDSIVEHRDGIAQSRVTDKAQYSPANGLRIVHTLTDAAGMAVCESEAPVFLRHESTMNTQTFTVEDVKLWDVECPYLYTLTTALFYGDRKVDETTQRVGFRTIEFTPDRGFFLNGRHLKLNGACMHHDLGCLGSAFNISAARRQIEKMQEIGINAIRTSHNPPAAHLLELCDEMGVLVDAEAFDMWEQPKTENDYGIYFHDWCERDMKNFVRRDRNHPSIIMWSIGNEIPDTNNPGSEEIAKRLVKAVRRNDSRHNAYTTIGSNFVAWPPAQKSSDAVELSGYNYLESIYDEHHEKFPHWCIYGSETASTVQSRGIYHFPKDNCNLTYEDMQCSCLDNCHTNWGAKSVHQVIAKDRDARFSAGQFIWTGWDYIGEPTPYFSKNSFFGQIDTAGFYKDTAYIYKAGWTDYRTAPFVHICPYWDFNEGQLIDINVNSNAPKVALFKDGELIGEKELDQKHDADFSANFRHPYHPGVLRAVAYDETGNVIAEDEVRSFSNPARIVCEPERESIYADGEDIMFIGISTVDEAGTFVANARNRMTVTVEGPGRIVGMDNGDSTDYDQYKTNSRKLFSGRLVVAVAATKEPGRITVKVSSPGLEGECVSFEAVPTEKVRDGISCDMKIVANDKVDIMHEIPVRKIELTAEKPLSFSPDCTEIKVTARIEPADATYRDITWKAVTPQGIESPAVDIEVCGDEGAECVDAKTDTGAGNYVTAVIKAKGDGVFRLHCSAANGKDHPEVMSELECEAEGLGNAYLNPYENIYGISCEGADKRTELGFRGGLHLYEDGTTVTYSNVDFGEFGSDRIAVAIFSFRDEEKLEIWDDDGELLYEGFYRVPTIYNVYQEDTFKLKRRIKGVRSISFRFEHGLDLGSFRFEAMEKAYSDVSATEYSMITGDSYDVRQDGVYEIGNNVDLEFTDMSFAHGVSRIAITGRANGKANPVHVRFTPDGSDETIKKMVEFPATDDIVTLEFDLDAAADEVLSGSFSGKVNFIFLPGSNFDFVGYRFS